MELDKEHKFNFFKKEEKRRSKITLALGMLSIFGLFAYIVPHDYYTKSYPENRSAVIPKGDVMFGVLTAQNTFSTTAGPTFVISPQSDHLKSPANSFESLSQKEKLTHWVENQEPGVQLTPAEIQKIVKIMQPPTK